MSHARRAAESVTHYVTHGASQVIRDSEYTTIGDHYRLATQPSTQPPSPSPLNLQISSWVTRLSERQNGPSLVATCASGGPLLHPTPLPSINLVRKLTGQWDP